MFGQGFYSQEQLKDATWRWMGDGLPKDGPVPLEGVVFLRNTRKDMTLTIAGAFPRYRPDAPPLVKLSLNGELLDEFRPDRQKVTKVYPVPAAKQGPDEYTELRFSIDKFFIPEEVEKNSTDSRRLAFRLTGLTWVEPDAPEPPGLPKPPGLPEPPAPTESVPEDHATPGPMSLWKILVPFALVVVGLVAGFALWQRRREQTIPRSGAGVQTTAEKPAPLSLVCRGCRRKLRVRANLAGKKVKCPQCGQVLHVPADSPSDPLQGETTP
jgi:hypothetical protein